MGTLGEGRRVRAFDLMHVTHPLCWLSYALRKWWERRVLPSLPLACQTSALLVSYAPEMEQVNGIAPLSRPRHGRIESPGGSFNFRLPRLIVLWPQKSYSDYSRKKVILSAAIITARAHAAVLKTCVLSRTGKGHSGPASR